jgi:SpoVK/Ycf46/Vps4 family AAA+-type ATPase
MSSDLLDALRRAVRGLPADAGLRLELARLLLERGLVAEALAECGEAVAINPGDAEALALLRSASEQLRTAHQEEPREVSDAKPDTASASADGAASGATDDAEFDWDAAAAELGEVARPMFVAGEAREIEAGADSSRRSEPSIQPVRLADVAGIGSVKARVEQSFLAPIRNPEMARLYGLSARGGLLMYGPPGCGKTFLGRALAGELAATFIAVDIADVLDMYLGQSERNLRNLFEHARRSAPSVLFFDEVDALGGRRSRMGNSAGRTTVNQLLAELDGIGADNSGVFVIGATNAPWDVEPALRRPGRFDRTVLVPAPDREARAAIFRAHLAQRPVDSIDLAELSTMTDGYSGADIAHVCTTAVEATLTQALATGRPHLVGMNTLRTAIGQTRPSMGPWLQSARNVVQFANPDGGYDELAAYLGNSRSRARRQR